MFFGGGGGFDFWLFEDMAKAFAYKLGWKLQLNVSPRAEFMHEKYIKGAYPSIVTMD